MTALSQLYSPSSKMRLATQNLIDAMTEGDYGVPLALVVGEQNSISIVPLLPHVQSGVLFQQMIKELGSLCNALLVEIPSNVPVQ